MAGCSGGGGGNFSGTQKLTIPSADGIVSNLTDRSPLSLPKKFNGPQPSARTFDQAGLTNYQAYFTDTVTAGTLFLRIGLAGTVKPGDVFELRQAGSEVGALAGTLIFTPVNETKSFASIDGQMKIVSVVDSGDKVILTFTLSNVHMTRNQESFVFNAAGKMTAIKTTAQ